MRRLWLSAWLLFAACGGKAISGSGGDDPSFPSGGSGGGASGGETNSGGAGVGGARAGGSPGAGEVGVGVGGVAHGGGGASGGAPSFDSLEPCGPAPRPGEPCLLPWRGVNLAGAEFGENVPGVVDLDYTYPGEPDLDYFAAEGMTAIRLPFRWERLQRTLREPLHAEELVLLEYVVTSALARGLYVILDPHNYARYEENGVTHVMGDGTLSAMDLVDFWAQLATRFKGDPRVVFGLMNEPHDLSTSVWVEAAQAALYAIRDTGAANFVLVPGNHWTGAHSWTKTDNAVALLDIHDPLDRFAYDVHQYFDGNYSGGSETCVHTNADELFGSLTAWLRTNRRRAFLGEFGGGAGIDCKAALTNALRHLESNADVWLGFAYWAGGPWWGDYFASISPYPDGSDKPQLDWLRPHLR